MSQTTTPLFEDWIEKLPTQTLTDELKRDIVQEHKAHSENLYTEEEVRAILFSFKNSFDKPCYTTQETHSDVTGRTKRSIDSLFPWKAFYKQHFKNYKNE